MNRVTRVDRVTPEPGSEAGRVTPVIGKKALCEMLGWSRPALDRRLRWDKIFPVLHCGKPGEAWQFDLPAVRAHIESNSGHRGRPPGSAGRPSGVTILAISRELERALAIRRTVAELLSELDVVLERLAAELALEGPASAPPIAREGLDGDSH